MTSPDAPQPLGSMGLLARARAGLERLTPQQALAAQQRGAHIVDLRTEAHRRASHEVPGGIVIDLTVLPWRLAPTFAWRIDEATGWDVEWVLLCRRQRGGLVLEYEHQPSPLVGSGRIRPRRWP